MLEIRNLSKYYGNKKAIDQISFSVGNREILGLLGTNGAGKSTTMNMITGYLASTSGDIRIDGIDVLDQPLLAKKKIGYLPEKPPLYLEMSVDAYLKYVAQLKKIAIPYREHISEVCEMTGITHVKQRIIRNLSKGYQQRVGIAQALLGYPENLILDEPMVGLDPKQIVEIRNLIQRLGEKHTVILSSHILSEIQTTCSRILVIHEGKLIADGKPDELEQKLGVDNGLYVALETEENQAYTLLQSIPGVRSVEKVEKKEEGIVEFLLKCEECADVRRPVCWMMSEQQIPIMGLRQEKTSLEQLFLTLTNTEKETNK